MSSDEAGKRLERAADALIELARRGASAAAQKNVKNLTSLSSQKSEFVTLAGSLRGLQNLVEREATRIKSAVYPREAPDDRRSTQREWTGPDRT